MEHRKVSEMPSRDYKTNRFQKGRKDYKTKGNFSEEQYSKW